MLVLFKAIAAACVYDSLLVPPPGACTGPMQRAQAMRENYNSIPGFQCAIDQSHCTVDGVQDCYQCCPEFNRLGIRNENCPLSHVCEKGVCVEVRASATFGLPCKNHYECGQLQCIQGMCESCEHGERHDAYSCVAGQWFDGLGAQAVTSQLGCGVAVAGVLMLVVLIIEGIGLLFKKQ